MFSKSSIIKDGTKLLESANLTVAEKLSFDTDFLLVFEVFEDDFCKLSFDILLENFGND